MSALHHHTRSKARPLPPRQRRSRARLRGLAATAVLAVLLAGTAALAYEAGRGSTTQIPAAAADPNIPPPPVPALQPAVNEPGPVLVDSTGAPLPADIAKSVRTVYTALDTGDLDPVHAAYSATGSDDWHTTEPHLGQGIVRQDVLAALRTPPAPGADTYIYSASGTSATFGWSSMGTGIGPGLHSISGPWLDFTTSTLDTSAPPEPLTPATADDEPPVPTSCTAGTLDQPIEGYPCTDPGTGRGVDYDGTVGVHGLKPCPYGTDIPTDPNEPTRNASTGETCGWSG